MLTRDQQSKTYKVMLGSVLHACNPTNFGGGDFETSLSNMTRSCFKKAKELIKLLFNMKFLFRIGDFENIFILVIMQ